MSRSRRERRGRNRPASVLVAAACSAVLARRAPPSASALSVWKSHGAGKGRFASAMRLSSVSAPSSVSSPAAAGGGFWFDPERVSSLPDPPPSDLLELIRRKPYKGGFEPASDVDPYEPEVVEGKIPEDLVGTLATNGPGRIRIGARQYGHWFDGDGYVTLLSLDGRANRARFAGRYVRSKRFRDQERLMAQLGGVEGITPKDGDGKDEPNDPPPLAFTGAWTLGGRGKWYENIFRIPTNPANTATMWLPPLRKGGEEQLMPPRLYALCEGGNPIQLDPFTLDVVGDEAAFTSTVGVGGERVQSFFSAHFSRCPITGDIYNHGYVIRPGPLGKVINMMRLSRDGVLERQVLSEMPFDTFTHDAVLSVSCIVYVVQPYLMPEEAILSTIAGQSPLASNYQWDSKTPCAIHVHSRSDLRLKWTIELPETMSMYHLVDAHDERAEDGDSTILRLRVAEHYFGDEHSRTDDINIGMGRKEVESQFSDQYQVEGQRIYSRLREYSFELKSDGTGRSTGNRTVATDAALCEYPTVNAAFQPERRRKYCWTNAASRPSVEWLDGVQKVDMDLGVASGVISFGEGNYAGAPAFVPREGASGEDDGYILVMVYRSKEHRSDVVILDAVSLDKLCVIALRDHVPHQFHGDFLPGFVA
uniref:Carotenoid oxygenase n=1 Tax=Odontella aurita TaxID=265563 RepID=A0A7S4K0C9_9STRA|mmetsp:Transcript_57910/g.172848  ORF Transcript_57910/g.172848 Transcript_57910/m.172848 type:complete len:647 (+) Transcript_57910:95-2035(+)